MLPLFSRNLAHGNSERHRSMVVESSAQALVQFDADRIGDVKRTREVDHNLSEVGEDAPVMRVVGIGQSGARHPPVKTHVIKLATERSQACLYVAQAIPVSKLGKAHRQILVPAREASRSGISAVSSHATTKFAIGQKAQQLRENGSALVHALLSAHPRFDSSELNRVSNRGNPNTCPTISNNRTCQPRCHH
jgi:hypothetical protein